MYSKGWMKMNTKKLLKLREHAFFNITNVMKHIPQRKHSSVNKFLFNMLFDKEVKHFTLNHYQIFMDHATECLDKLPEYLQKQR